MIKQFNFMKENNEIYKSNIKVHIYETFMSKFNIDAAAEEVEDKKISLRKIRRASNYRNSRNSQCSLDLKANRRSSVQTSLTLEETTGKLKLLLVQSENQNGQNGNYIDSTAEEEMTSIINSKNSNQTIKYLYDRFFRKPHRQRVMNDISMDLHQLEVLWIDNWFNVKLITNPTKSIKSMHSNKWQLLVQEDSQIFILWGLVMSCFLLVNIITIPFEMSQEPLMVNNNVQILFSLVLEVIFIFDILFNFITTYKNEYGIEVYSNEDIAINYLQNWFAIDFVSSVPIELLHTMGLMQHVHVNNGYLKFMKLPKQIKIVRQIMKIFISRMQQIIMDMFESLFDLNQLNKLQKMLSAIIIFFFVANILVCWYVSFVKQCEQSLHDHDITMFKCPNNWFQVSLRAEQELAINNTEHEMYEYLTSLKDSNPEDLMNIFQDNTVREKRWVLQIKSWQQVIQTVTTVGYGDMASVGLEDNIFRVACMLVGVILFTQVSSAIMENSIVDNLEGEDRFNRRKQIETITKRQQLSKESRKQLSMLSESSQSESLQGEVRLINLLPQQMKNTIQFSIRQMQALKFNFILNESQTFFEHFYQKCSLRKCIIDEKIPCGPNVYFIWQGQVGVKLINVDVMNLSEYVSECQTGDDFGYDMILNEITTENKHYICINDAELLIVNLDDLFQCLHQSLNATQFIFDKLKYQVQELFGIVQLNYQMLKKGHQIDFIWYREIVKLLNLEQREFRWMQRCFDRSQRNRSFNGKDREWCQQIFDKNISSYLRKNLNSLMRMIVKDRQKWVVPIKVPHKSLLSKLKISLNKPFEME